MLGIGEELGIFVHAILSGIIVLVSYTCIRVIRRIIKHNLAAITIEDFLFWIGTGLYLFVEIYYTSDGSIRWFFVLGVVFGMFFFSLLLTVAKKVYRKFYASFHRKK